MSYVSLTDADRDAMLETIGVASVAELFEDIPAGVRFERLSFTSNTRGDRKQDLPLPKEPGGKTVRALA